MVDLCYLQRISNHHRYRSSGGRDLEGQLREPTKLSRDKRAGGFYVLETQTGQTLKMVVSRVWPLKVHDLNLDLGVCGYCVLPTRANPF